jgi:hypothetical protein
MATSYTGQLLSQWGQNLPILLNQRKTDAIQQVQQQRKNQIEDEDRATAKEQLAKKNVVDAILGAIEERKLKNIIYEDSQREAGDKALDEFESSKRISTLPISPEYALNPPKLAADSPVVPTSFNPPKYELPQPGMSDLARADKFALRKYSPHNKSVESVMGGIDADQKIAEAKTALQENRDYLAGVQDKNFANEMEKEKYTQGQQTYRAMNKPVGVGGKNQQVIGYNEDESPVYGASAQRLSQATIKSLEEVKNFPALLNGLRASIKTNGDVMGPVQGRLQSGLVSAGIVTSGSKKAAELNGRYEAVKQVVAKGMEGGVLRAEDMPKYEKILGSIKLQPEFAES